MTTCLLFKFTLGDLSLYINVRKIGIILHKINVNLPFIFGWTCVIMKDKDFIL